MIFAPSLADWELDPLLERDTVAIGDMPLCRVLLIKDANYPWLLLVPRRHQAVEITDLDMIEQAQLMSEIAHASRTLKALTAATRSMSRRSAMWWRSSMSMSSRARAATPPGPGRCGTRCRPANTTRRAGQASGGAAAAADA